MLQNHIRKQKAFQSGELGDKTFESKYIASAIPAPITMKIRIRI